MTNYTPTKTGLSHSCPDGTYTRQMRVGPLGIGPDSFIYCPRCGDMKDTATLQREYDKVKPRIIAALAKPA